MKPNQELYQLIKSLSKTEKTYFRKFAARHFKHSNTFIKLFNELEKKKEKALYDENDIKGKYSDEKFTSQLPVTKNYLYNNILKSLNLYYTEDNIEIKLSSLINSAMILYRRELFGQCMKIICKAKKLAERYDKPSKLLEAIHIERQTLRINSSLNEVSIELLKNYDEEQEVLKKLKNISEYRKLYDTLVIYASAKGMSRDKEYSAKLEKLEQNRMLKNYKQAQYFQSRVLFMLMHCVINNLKGEHGKSYDFGKKVLEIIGDSYDNKSIVPYEYMLALQEMTFSSYSLRYIDEAEKYFDIAIEEQDVLLKNSPDKVKNFMRLRTLIGRLNINNALGRFSENERVIMDVIALSSKNEGNSYRDEILVANFLAAIIYFALGKYDDSLFYLNKIFNSKAFELREDIQITCRILNLILHFELGHISSLDYYVESTYRYLKKNHRLGSYERLVLYFIKKSQSAANGKELSDLIKMTVEEIMNLKNSGEVSRTMQSLDLSSWLGSKLRKK